MQTRTPGGEIATVERESLVELFSELGNKSSALIRDEIELAKQELSEKIVSFKKGAILLIVAAGIGALAVLTLTAAAVIALAPYVGLLYSALIIGGVFLVIGAIVASVGMRRVKETSLKPEQTIETLQEDKEWLKELP
jgi:uncharacterized membrane protein YqjE